MGLFEPDISPVNDFSPLPGLTKAVGRNRDGTITAYTAAIFLDSISSFPFIRASNIINAALNSADIEYAAGAGAASFSTIFPFNTGNPAFSAPVSGTNTAIVGDYSSWLTGEFARLSIGEFPLNISGANPFWSKIGIGYFVRAGGGTIRWKIGGALVGVATGTDPASNPGKVAGDFVPFTTTQAYGQTSASLVIAGANVDVVQPWIEVGANISKFLVYNYAKGGIALNDAMGSAQSRANLGASLSTIHASQGINLASYNAKENASYLTQYLGLFSDVLDANIASADKIYFGGYPYNLDVPTNNDQILQNNIIENLVSVRANLSLPYRYVDAYAPFVMGNSLYAAPNYITNVLGVSFYGDGMHYNIPGLDMAYATFTQMCERASFIGARSMPVKAPFAPSYFGNNTSIQGGNNATTTLKISSDGVIGTTYQLQFGAALEMSNQAGAIIGRRVVSGAAVNVDPLAMTFYSAVGTAMTITRAQRTATGKSFYYLADSSTGGGGARFSAGGILPVAQTLAQATTDYPGNSHNGCTVVLSDGVTGLGAGLYLAGGQSGGDFRYVLAAKATQTTVGAAGAASAVPALPTGYLKVRFNAIDYAIPYYLAA